MIRQEYVEQLKQHREEYPEWGGSAVMNCGDNIVRYLRRHKTVTSVLDFGCGTGSLASFVRARIDRYLDWHEYDPSVPGKDKAPTRDFGVILSVDVLEHVERESLTETLNWINEHCNRQLHHIDCNTNWAQLPDGRDVHVLVQSPDAWEVDLLTHNPGWTILSRTDVRQLKRGVIRTACTFVMEK